MNMVDELVAFADYDPVLKEGIAWLDKTDMYGKDLDFYDKVYQCLHNHDVNQKASEWLRQRTNQQIGYGELK